MVSTCYFADNMQILDTRQPKEVEDATRQRIAEADRLPYCGQRPQTISNQPIQMGAPSPPSGTGQASTCEALKIV
jgi:hypothetical protein